METISILTEKPLPDFDTARKITGALAKSLNPETSLLAWFDKKQNKRSPSEVLCDAEGVPGWEEYGRHHGGQKKVIIGNGDYIFIYT